MKSLKAVLPILSEYTGISVTALYERQRALVRLGLLPAPTKSGRNSGGALATPGPIAVMLVSVLVTDNLSEMDSRIQEFLSLRTFYNDPVNYPNPREKEGHCPFTGQRTLYRALCAVLKCECTPPMVGIEVVRKQKIVRLIDLSQEQLPSTFGRESGRRLIEHTTSFSDLWDLSNELDLIDPSVIIPEQRYIEDSPLAILRKAS